MVGPLQPNAFRLPPEKLAYWYFRLNGFLQIENFVVHPGERGPQRTDADLPAVRFPHRAERLVDDPDDIMVDDEAHLALSNELIDVAIVEVKTSRRCSLNGPWTQPDEQNIHRVIAALGCLPPDQIHRSAKDIYNSGLHVSERGLRVRLIAVGRSFNRGLTGRYPKVTQLVWNDMLAFIWNRLKRYEQQKRQVGQWDEYGQHIRDLVAQSNDLDAFKRQALHSMGVRQ